MFKNSLFKKVKTTRVSDILGQVIAMTSSEPTPWQLEAVFLPGVTRCIIERR